MKKIFLCLVSICFILTGCGKQDEKTVLKEFQEMVDNSKSYYLSGNMELVNNEDVYTYDVMVSYKKEDYYKIELTNVINNHRQIILRNDEGVYIVTPSLNKSFKFQSDWPYNNSQVYLLSSLLDDISNDEDRKFEIDEDGYVFISSVNYPNNPKLVNQKVYIGQSINSLDHRKKQHYKESKYHKNDTTYFHNALKKYSEQDFIWEILEELTSLEELNSREIYWIEYYQSTNKEKGYNLILATNPIFPRIATLNRIKWAGLDPNDFMYISTYENSHYSKPSIKYYEEILNKLNLNKEECLMIGNDTSEDYVITNLDIPCIILKENLINKNNLDLDFSTLDEYYLNTKNYPKIK